MGKFLGVVRNEMGSSVAGEVCGAPRIPVFICPLRISWSAVRNPGIVGALSPTCRRRFVDIRRQFGDSSPGILRYFQIRGDESRIVCHMPPNCSWNALSIRRHVEWSQTVRILVMSANQSWNFSTIWFGYKFVDKIRQCNTTFKAGRTRINIKWT